MCEAIATLLTVNRNEFPFFDLIIPYVGKYSLMTLTRVCRAFYLSLKKSPFFRQIQYLWRHVCVICGDIRCVIQNGRRLCYLHLPEQYHWYPYTIPEQYRWYHDTVPVKSCNYSCICSKISNDPNDSNDRLCAACGESFLIEKNISPFDNCHCYVQLDTPKRIYIRYYNVVRIVLQDERIVYAHKHCNQVNWPCPFSYDITHVKDCHGIPKPPIDMDSD
jgi:hypothetical protein